MIVSVVIRIALFVLACAGLASGQPLVVTLLGTDGGPPVLPDRAGPSVLIEAGEERLLIDAGRGAMVRLRQLGIQHVSKLFLTHLHSDHLVSLTDVWLTGWARGRPAPFAVWGPQGTKRMMAHLEQAFIFDIRMRRDVDTKIPGDGVRVIATNIEEGVAYENNDLKVTAFDVDHRPIKPALGYRVDFGDYSVVVSGDTRKSDNLVKFSKDADVVVHEVYGADPEQAPNPAMARTIMAHHTTIVEAAEAFSWIEPRLAVYYHIVPFFLSQEQIEALSTRTNETYDGWVEAGEELMRIEIADEIKVLRFNADYQTH